MISARACLTLHHHEMDLSVDLPQIVIGSEDSRTSPDTVRVEVKSLLQIVEPRKGSQPPVPDKVSLPWSDLYIILLCQHKSPNPSPIQVTFSSLGLEDLHRHPLSPNSASALFCPTSCDLRPSKLPPSSQRRGFWPF